MLRAMVRAWCVSALVALLVACGPALTPTGDDRRGDVNGRLFEFSTGGSEHTGEYGAWLVRVRGNAIWIARVRDGATKEFGPMALDAADERKLWKLIDEVDVLGRSSKKVRSKRTPVYQFTLMRPKVTAYTVVLPMGPALKDEEVASLVAFIGSLVRRYTDERPVLTPQENDDGDDAPRGKEREEETDDAWKGKPSEGSVND